MAKYSSVCSTAIALALGTLPYAQAADTPAAQQSNGVAGLEEIVVTAQRRGEEVNTVPIVITAVTGDVLASRQILTATELPRLVPDLHVVSLFGAGAQTFTIRGVGPANQYNFNVLQPVGAYMDEIFQPFSAAPGLQMFDLARVEVLKGPQGTLYGRNTTGGAINFISKGPDLTGSAEGANGHASLGYANLNNYTAEAAGDLILVPDKFGIRLAAFRSDGDGYMRNIGTVGPDHLSGGSNTQGRITAVYDSGNGFDATLRLYMNKSDSEMAGALAYGIGPGNTNLGGFSRDGMADDEVWIDAYRDNYGRSSQAGLTLNWDLGQWKLTSLTSFQDSKARINADCDGSPVTLCVDFGDMEGDQFSQDVRVAYETDKLNLITGAFYAKDYFEQMLHLNFFDFTYTENYYEQDRDTYGIYFDGVYHVSDKLSLTLGARYTDDSTELSKIYSLITDGFYGPPLFMTIPAGPYVPGKYLDPVKETSDGVSGRAILTYNFDPDRLVYASYSRGYRSGAFNGQFYFSESEVNSTGPEYVDNYELGTKLGLWDRRAQLNMTAFYTKLKDQQVLTTIDVAPCPDCDPPTPGSATTGLGGLDGSILGADFELDVQLLDNLRGHATLSLLDSKYDEGPGQVLSGVPVGGNKFAFVSGVSALAGLEWTAWQSGGAALVLTADGSYKGQYYYNPENGETSVGARMRDGQKPFWLLDASARYTNGRYSVLLWGKNLTDQFYMTAMTSAEAAFGEDYGFRGPPRSYGINFGIDF